MRKIDTPLTVEGKGQKNKKTNKGKSFGYQVLGFGAGGASGEFIIASGGTITECGSCKIHTFTSSGTFTVCSLSCCSDNNAVGYMVVAGGGGSGRYHGGGGGAGGFREGRNNPITPYTASPLVTTGITVSCSPGSYTVTVGGGGATNPNPNPAGGGPGSKGSNSVFSSITSTGGGYGGGTQGGAAPGGPGGSGGGGGGTSGCGTGGTGNSPSVSPPQGQPGGARISAQYAAGGGGATTGGPCANSGPPYAFGTGGHGAGTGINPSSSFGGPGPCGSLRYFAGGGGSGAIGGGCSEGAGGGPCGGVGQTGIIIIRYKFK